MVLRKSKQEVIFSSDTFFSVPTKLVEKHFRCYCAGSCTFYKMLIQKRSQEPYMLWQWIVVNLGFAMNYKCDIIHFLKIVWLYDPTKLEISAIVQHVKFCIKFLVKQKDLKLSACFFSSSKKWPFFIKSFQNIQKLIIFSKSEIY